MGLIVSIDATMNTTADLSGRVCSRVLGHLERWCCCFDLFVFPTAVGPGNQPSGVFGPASPLFPYVLYLVSSYYFTLSLGTILSLFFYRR